MSEGSSRRTFLRDAFVRGARTGREMLPGSSLIRELNPTPAPAAKPQRAPSPPRIGRTAPPEPLPAQPTQRRAPLHELFALATELDLVERLGAVRALARPSVRLCPDPEATSESSHACGIPRLPVGVAWPRLGGAELTFLATVDLTAAREVPPLPPTSHDARAVLVFAALADLAPGSREAVPACLIPVGLGATTAPEGPVASPQARPLGTTTELTLPRVWSAPVQALGLRADERERWTELRRRLGEAQGIEPYEPGAPPRRCHRLFGYPDETSGTMPALCADAAAASGTGGEGPWHLLAQLETDPETGWDWGAPGRRLYIWGNEDIRLGATSPAPAWALLR